MWNWNCLRRTTKLSHALRESDDMKSSVETTEAIERAVDSALAEVPGSEAVCDVLKERRRQEAKWGEQNHDPFTYLTVLGEEYGELCQAALHSKFGGKAAEGLRYEAVQVAAVALAIVECLDRKKWSWPQNEGTEARERRALPTVT